MCTKHEKLVIVKNTHNYKIISGPDIVDGGHVCNNVYPSRPTVIRVFSIPIKYYILPLYSYKIVNSGSLSRAPPSTSTVINHEGVREVGKRHYPLFGCTYNWIVYSWLINIILYTQKTIKKKCIWIYRTINMWKFRGKWSKYGASFNIMVLYLKFLPWIAGIFTIFLL